MIQGIIFAKPFTHVEIACTRCQQNKRETIRALGLWIFIEYWSSIRLNQLRLYSKRDGYYTISSTLQKIDVSKRIKMTYQWWLISLLSGIYKLYNQTPIKTAFELRFNIWKYRKKYISRWLYLTVDYLYSAVHLIIWWTLFSFIVYWLTLSSFNLFISAQSISRE